LIDNDGVRLCLSTAATSEPIVRPPCDMWAWRAMVVMMPPGDNSWLVHQSSLAVLLAETPGASRRNRRKRENFAYQYLRYLKGFLHAVKSYDMGHPALLSIREEGVLRIFIAIKNQSPRPSLNPPPLGPVASTLTTTPPRRLRQTLLLLWTSACGDTWQMLSTPPPLLSWITNEIAQLMQICDQTPYRWDICRLTRGSHQERSWLILDSILYHWIPLALVFFVLFWSYYNFFLSN
jgi:hypothetical protein